MRYEIAARTNATGFSIASGGMTITTPRPEPRRSGARIASKYAPWSALTPVSRRDSMLRKSERVGWRAVGSS
jgi:hypothetical protein